MYFIEYIQPRIIIWQTKTKVLEIIVENKKNLLLRVWSYWEKLQEVIVKARSKCRNPWQVIVKKQTTLNVKNHESLGKKKQKHDQLLLKKPEHVTGKTKTCLSSIEN